MRPPPVTGTTASGDRCLLLLLLLPAALAAAAACTTQPCAAAAALSRALRGQRVHVQRGCCCWRDGLVWREQRADGAGRLERPPPRDARVDVL
jgi:hypothetical protein